MCKQNRWGCPISPHIVEQDARSPGGEKPRTCRRIETFMGRHYLPNILHKCDRFDLSPRTDGKSKCSETMPMGAGRKCAEESAAFEGKARSAAKPTPRARTNRIGRALRVAMPPAECFNTFKSHPNRSTTSLIVANVCEFAIIQAEFKVGERVWPKTKLKILAF